MFGPKDLRGDFSTLQAVGSTKLPWRVSIWYLLGLTTLQLVISGNSQSWWLWWIILSTKLDHTEIDTMAVKRMKGDPEARGSLDLRFRLFYWVKLLGVVKNCSGHAGFTLTWTAPCADSDLFRSVRQRRVSSHRSTGRWKALLYNVRVTLSYTNWFHVEVQRQDMDRSAQIQTLLKIESIALRCIIYIYIMHLRSHGAVPVPDLPLVPLYLERFLQTTGRTCLTTLPRRRKCSSHRGPSWPENPRSTGRFWHDNCWHPAIPFWDIIYLCLVWYRFFSTNPFNANSTGNLVFAPSK